MSSYIFISKPATGVKTPYVNTGLQFELLNYRLYGTTPYTHRKLSICDASSCVQLLSLSLLFINHTQGTVK